MADLLIYSTGNGTDTDFDTTESLFNSVYLSLFGGNVSEDTPETPTEGKQRTDWWGNSLFNTEQQFNSVTERTIEENTLSGQGLKNIREAIEIDLKWLAKLSVVEVFLEATNVNTLIINVSLTEPEGDVSQTFNFVWDATQKELIEKTIL